MQELEDPRGILISFPIYNLLSAFVLSTYVRGSHFNREDVPEDDAKLQHVVAGLIIILSVVLFGSFVFQVYWDVTLSMCLAMAVSLESNIGAINN
mgnify:CR=1 FL=1